MMKITVLLALTLIATEASAQSQNRMLTMLLRLKEQRLTTVEG